MQSEIKAILMSIHTEESNFFPTFIDLNIIDSNYNKTYNGIGKSEL